MKEQDACQGKERKVSRHTAASSWYFAWMKKCAGGNRKNAKNGVRLFRKMAYFQRCRTGHIFCSTKRCRESCRRLQIPNRRSRHVEARNNQGKESGRSYGSFSRSVELPAEVHGEKARASFKNGVLEIRLPKTEEAKKKEVQVKVE
ncbi:MAG TPA: Hsp20/alpha crystallin family protein [Candidatus Binatia bacterium]|jgi:hypothetical protein